MIPPQKHYQGREQSDTFPKGYLAHGYLDERGNIFPELITDHAAQVAKLIRDISSSQFRRFFNHARSIELRIRQGKDFAAVRYELDRMGPLALAASVDRNAKLPDAFAEMIQRMVAAVRTLDDFLKGFMPHFEAVLAYYTYYTGKNSNARGVYRR